VENIRTENERRCSALPSFGKRFRMTAIAAGATISLGAWGFGALGPSPGGASSHREAPLVSADPQVDGTDLYAFVSPDNTGTVTIISNWIPFEEPAGGPNFYAFAPGVQYDIDIDNDGDARADIIYRWIFQDHYRNKKTFLYNTGVVNHLTDTTLNFYQTYDLYRIYVGSGSTKLLSNARVAPSDVGNASMPDYDDLRAEAIRRACNSACKFWAGQSDDPFFLDLRVFDLLYGARFCSGHFCESGHDTLEGFNVNAFAMQVPKADLAKGGDRSHVIGVWTTAQRRSIRTQRSNGSQSFSGDFVRVSRLGNPLVNEVVIPVGLKDRFNGSRPADDGQFAPFVLDPELPHDVKAIYGLPVPDCDGNPDDGNVSRACDLVPVFLTGLPGLNKPPKVTPSEQLRLNMDTPVCQPGTCSAYSRLGVIAGDAAGFPNGRRLADDVIDIALQVVEGCLITSTCSPTSVLTDRVDRNDEGFTTHFPYLSEPHAGSTSDPHSAFIRRV
jgi:hypothetical protein